MISRVVLINFRNYHHKEIDLAATTTVFLGDNATGKTNFLEAVYLLATGESFRAQRIEEMVRFGEELGRVRAVRPDEPELEVMVTGGLVGGKTVAKRKYLIDGAGKRKGDFVGQIAAVIFRPEDMLLVEGSPSGRRKFLDRASTQVDRDYTRSLAVYEQALRRRNRLLQDLKDGKATRHSLAFWDSLVIKHGQVLQEKRMDLVAFINDLWSRSELFNHLVLEYDKSLINEERLLQYALEEVAAGYTLVGPHKDDFRLLSKERNLGTFGSRGEQRMAVLALKIGELYFLENRRGDSAILLLDDIFSELDVEHRAEVLRVMQNRQVVLTSALNQDVEAVSAETVVHL